MRKLLLSLILISLLALLGCRSPGSPGRQSEMTETKMAQTQDPGEQQEKSNNPVKGQDSAGQIELTGEDAEDLVIKSENQVSAGSKQEMVNELDQEVDKLVESLNNLESVEDADLIMD